MITLVCQHPGCFERFRLGPYERDPSICSGCLKKAKWSAHWEPDPDAPRVTVPNGLVREHRYTLTKRDWLLLFGCRINPEITYSEAE